MLIDTYEKDTLTEKDISPIDKTEQTYCPIIQNKILINESKNSQDVFEKLISKVSVKKPLSFIDKVVLWSLLQINLRPDQNSPTSKLQFALNYNQKEYYFNVFSSDKEDAPYFYLLEHLLKTFKSRHSLSSLATLYDNHMQRSLLVTEGLEEFLIQNKKELATHPILSKIYMRGDETLKRNERLPKLEILPLVRFYLKKKNPKNYQVKQFLFKFQDQASFVPHCNFDMGLYENSIFLISKDYITSNLFGMKDHENTFFAVSSQKLDKLTSYASSMVFEGSSSVRSASICLFKNRLKKDNRLWMVSTASRDPGQHLYHYLEYGLNEVNSIKELDTMMKFSRHLFLKNPVRLVFEAKRSDQKQIQELLKLDIPLYNAKSLGRVWGFFQNQTESSFILDARRAGAISCKSN